MCKRYHQKSTMKITKSKIILTFLVFIFFNAKAHAWGGYDYDEKTTIDIGPGNLVREGSIIQFYDNKADSYHTAKILLMEEASGEGTALRVDDFEMEMERVFFMES